MIDSIQFRIITGLYRQRSHRSRMAGNVNSSRNVKTLSMFISLMMIGTLLQFSFDVNNNDIYHMDGSSVQIKTEKCQPAAWDMPDLIQTEHVPSSWLTRPTNKNQRNVKYKNSKIQIIC